MSGTGPYLADVARLRLATGQQLERLHFAELAEPSRGVVRRRVLRRLVAWQVLTTLDRRVGGVRAGSDGLVYGLDLAGKKLAVNDTHAKRPNLPGLRYVRHVLAVSELYVSLVERSRDGQFRLARFEAEPACWWPDGRGGLLKPDVYVNTSNAKYQDHYWIEADLATEHIPTLRHKLMTYWEFYRRGESGPGKLMPWVLLTVPDTKRYSDVVRLIRQLPSQSQELFTVTLHNDAADSIVRMLSQP